MNYDESHDDLDELPAAPRKTIPDADRQLLELAARAIGARFEEVDGEGYGNLHFDDGSVVYSWNSLQFSGDALDLAVQLNLHIEIDFDVAGVVTIEWDFGDSTTARFSIEEFSPQGGDDRAATCRAVTRAAAEVGKQHS